LPFCSSEDSFLVYQFRESTCPSNRQHVSQSIREYCERHDVTETSFHYWRRELRQRDAQVSTRGASPTFVPVRVIPATTVAVKIRCPSGHVVTLSACDASVLRGLFAALAPEASC
jgi:transposase-like protein